MALQQILSTMAFHLRGDFVVLKSVAVQDGGFNKLDCTELSYCLRRYFQPTHLYCNQLLSKSVVLTKYSGIVSNFLKKIVLLQFCVIARLVLMCGSKIRMAVMK